MYASEIDTILSKDRYLKNQFLGVFSADQLATLRLPRRKKYCLVVNTDPKHKPGRHWQAIAVDGGTCYFFCSLAEKPNHYISKFLRRFPRLIKNPSRQQRLNEVTCGGFVIFVLSMLARGYTFKKLCNLFAKLSSDDMFIRAYLFETHGYSMRPPLSR